jgi:hypothetical protein
MRLGHDASMIRFVVALGIVLVAIPACSSSSNCSCFDPGIQINAEGVSLASISASGSACTNAKISCGDGSAFAPSCHLYYVVPLRSGDCSLEIQTTTGAVTTASLALKSRSGLCACGFDGESVVTVTPPDASTDG